MRLNYQKLVQPKGHNLAENALSNSQLHSYTDTTIELDNLPSTSAWAQTELQCVKQGSRYACKKNAKPDFLSQCHASNLHRCCSSKTNHN